MRIRTFVIILLVLGAVYAVVSIYLSNRELLAQPVQLKGNLSISVGATLLWAFSAGLLVTLLAGLAREAGLMIERWRLRKANRKSEQIEEEYARGLVADLEGRHEEALGHFRTVLERAPRHFNTLIKMGDVLRGQGRYAEAIEYHRKAHHIKEEDTRPLYALVEDHEAKGDIARARAVLGKIIGINKNSVAAWRKLRSLHAKESAWDPALDSHGKVSKLARPLAPGDRAIGLGIRYEIASKQLDEGKTREAIGGLRRLLKEEPTFRPAHVRLGQALEKNGQENEAVRAWQNGFEATCSPVFLTLLEEHFLQRERPMAAIEALRQCGTHTAGRTLARFCEGKLYSRLEMLDDALAVLSSLEGRAAHAPALHYLLGRIHERRRNFREAAVEFRKVIKEIDRVQLDYKCSACDRISLDWTHRCTCGEWDTGEVNFREELPAEELGLAPAPMYSAKR